MIPMNTVLNYVIIFVFVFIRNVRSLSQSFSFNSWETIKNNVKMKIKIRGPTCIWLLKCGRNIKRHYIRYTNMLNTIWLRGHYLNKYSNIQTCRENYSVSHLFLVKIFDNIWKIRPNFMFYTSFCSNFQVVKGARI